MYNCVFSSESNESQHAVLTLSRATMDNMQACMYMCYSHVFTSTHECVGDGGMFNGRPRASSDVKELFGNWVHCGLDMQLHGSFHLKH